MTLEELRNGTEQSLYDIEDKLIALEAQKSVLEQFLKHFDEILKGGDVKPDVKIGFDTESFKNKEEK